MSTNKNADLIKTVNKAKVLKRRADLVGRRFGLLVVQSFHSVQNGKAKWVCLCDCGKTNTPTTTHLNSGNTTSCGCRVTISGGSVVKRHGASTSRTRNSWASMKARCSTESRDEYRYYGGRGITVCKEWEIFENFLDDMGEAPDGLTLDRIDHEKGYCKENCRWATRLEQTRNRRSTVMYEGEPLAAISERLGIKHTTLYFRLRRTGTIHLIEKS